MRVSSVSKNVAVLLSLTAVTVSSLVNGAPNNAPSFDPGFEPVSSHCDGQVRFPEWARNVTDNDGGTSGMSFHVVQVSNSHIFSQYPHVSWPSHTLTYQLKPDTLPGIVATVTAVLKDTSGTGQGGQDTSAPRSWNIYTKSCEKEGDANSDTLQPETPVDGNPEPLTPNTDTDSDGDGISDTEEGSGVLDTDGDGTPDSRDTDSDNDGIGDIDERSDSDSDGIRDSEEVNGADVSTDSDSDGITDEFDIDDDNDGITDELEGLGLIDTDGDRLPDSLDLDSDNDGISDLLESGIKLEGLEFSADGAITGPTGLNGYADRLETEVDAGPGPGVLSDTNEDGIPDFQDDAGLMLADESGAINGTLVSGLKGVGCAIGDASARDPLLIIVLLFASVGVFRRTAGLAVKM